MEKIYTGQCACGAVRIEATGDPVAELHCQCKDCQRRSGTGHSSFIVFANAAGGIIDGETKSWSVLAESGNEKLQAFCPTCGTPTHVTFPTIPGITAISAGLLDRPEEFAPKFVTFSGRALPWDHLAPGMTKFEKLPPR